VCASAFAHEFAFQKSDGRSLFFY